MERILVGYDGSEQAGRALEQGAELARRFGAGLTVLTAAADRLVREDGVVTPATDEDAGRRIAALGAERARGLGVKEVTARMSVEAPDDAIVLEAARGYDLVVVGHRGLGGLRELFLGSTAKSVIDRVPCSVLVVR